MLCHLLSEPSTFPIPFRNVYAGKVCFPTLGLGQLHEEEPSLAGSPLLHSASLRAAHTAPRKACFSPGVFTSSFAGFWDVGFICSLGRGRKAQVQGDCYYHQLSFGEVVPIFMFLPALLPGPQ